MNNADNLARELPWPVRFAHWFWAHRALRWGAIVLVSWLALIGLFYAEEDWRGERDWLACKTDAEAKGHDLAWTVPPRVPVEQNFFGAPNMQQWFTGRGGNTLSSRLSVANYGSSSEARDENKVADITVVPADATIAPGSADIVLRYDGPHAISIVDEKNARVSSRSSASSVRAVTEQLNILIAAAVEAATNKNDGLMCDAAVGFKLVATPLPKIKPVRVVVKTDAELRSDQIGAFFPVIGFKTQIVQSHVSVQSTGTNSFAASLDSLPFVTAADYLARSDDLQPDLDAVHQALNRPYARMDGDYGNAPTIPIPNFVCTRIMAQMLAQRTQSYLLLGQPEKAVKEQLFIRDLCKLLEGRPTSKPMTLVAAMINVAVTGLYVQTFGDGLRLHAWREPQLAAIEEQLGKIDLQSYALSAFEWEASCHAQILESNTPGQLADLFSYGRTQTLWEKMKDPVRLFCIFAPRGWIYENMTCAVRLQENMTGGFNTANHTIVPKIWDDSMQAVDKEFSRPSPYNFLASQLIPNFSRATLIMSKNQTLVNEAYLVCALERYRMARGNYPEKLDALVPQFADKIPADIIGGEPLKYRVADGKFTLYSIGWNEKDDGGVSAWTNGVDGDLKKNDWVWPCAP